MLKRIVLSVLTAFTVGLAAVVSVMAAEEMTSPSGPAPTPVPSQQQAKPVVSGVTQAAVKGGVLACAGRINQVTNFLTANTQSGGAYLFMPPTNPDRSIFSVSFEISRGDAPPAYASASFAPNQANGCGGMYETVVYWPQACDSVMRGSYGALKRAGVIAGTIAVLDVDAGTRIFLMPAGSGCVSIKKEVVP